MSIPTNPFTTYFRINNHDLLTEDNHTSSSKLRTYLQNVTKHLPTKPRRSFTKSPAPCCSNISIKKPELNKTRTLQTLLREKFQTDLFNATLELSHKDDALLEELSLCHPSDATVTLDRFLHTQTLAGGISKTIVKPFLKGHPGILNARQVRDVLLMLEGFCSAKEDILVRTDQNPVFPANFFKLLSLSYITNGFYPLSATSKPPSNFPYLTKCYKKLHKENRQASVSGVPIYPALNFFIDLDQILSEYCESLESLFQKDEIPSILEAAYSNKKKHRLSLFGKK